MKIAVTRLEGKETTDATRCAGYGHTCYSVHPLRSDLRTEEIASFVHAAERGEFDAIFFTSALPAKIIGPFLKKYPRMIAIGPQTARELKHFGIQSEILPGYYSRDFVPYLGDWIKGKRIGIPRADVPNPDLIRAISEAGGIPREFRCYHLIPTGEKLDLTEAQVILFTSAMSFTKAVWEPRDNIVVMAIGEITAGVMKKAGVHPDVVGDGSLEGSLRALNAFLERTEGH